MKRTYVLFFIAFTAAITACDDKKDKDQGVPGLKQLDNATAELMITHFRSHNVSIRSDDDKSKNKDSLLMKTDSSDLDKPDSLSAEQWSLRKKVIRAEFGESFIKLITSFESVKSLTFITAAHLSNSPKKNMPTILMKIVGIASGKNTEEVFFYQADKEDLCPKPDNCALDPITFLVD